MKLCVVEKPDPAQERQQAEKDEQRLGGSRQPHYRFLMTFIHGEETRGPSRQAETEGSPGSEQVDQPAIDDLQQDHRGVVGGGMHAEQPIQTVHQKPSGGSQAKDGVGEHLPPA